MSPLPIWVQYVQALGLPIFSAVLALVGGWIGWQQMQVASVRLHLDLYERRYRVFEALRELIRHAAYQTDLDVEAVRAHAFTAGQAGFVFDDGDGTAEYVLQKRNQVAEVLSLRSLMREADGQQMELLGRKLNSLQLYLKGVLDPTRTHEPDNLVKQFERSLKLPKVKTFPWQ
jgi:hypothetical protein